MSTVTVRGTALAAVTPDRAELGLALSHLAADAATALDAIAERSQRLEQILGNHGFSRSDWATDGVHVAEEYQWKQDTNVLVGHRASTALTVTVRSAGLVGPIIRDAVTVTGASVRNLSWRVDADNPARRELLAAAARDAKVRATAYVEALGLRLGEVEAITEAPLAADNGPQPQPMQRLAAAKLSDGAEISVSGGLVELHAEVTVRFAMLP